MIARIALVVAALACVRPSVAAADDPPLAAAEIARLEDAITHARCQPRRDAVKKLGRTKPTAEQRPFWLAQLAHRDLVVRFFALSSLSQLADARDFEPALRQLVAAPSLGIPLAVYLRSWRDRRAVPALVELLDVPAAAENAALSLSMLPFCPQLEPDLGVAEHHETYWTQSRDRVSPYRRWWKSRGAVDFKVELAWWTAWKAKLVPDKDLIADAPCGNE